MTTDRLGALIESYREETAHRDRDARVVRASVLREFDAGRKTVRLRPWLVPLFAALVGTGALAATSNRVDPTRLMASLRPAVTAQGERPTHRAAPGPHVAATPRRAEDANHAAEAPRPREIVPLEDLPVDGPIAAPNAAPSHRVERDGARAAPVPERGPTEELALYRVAHDLHFGGKEPARALAAFEEYLARYPGGTLAAEARFNEAVCLARLGRRSEAVLRLEPFAAGAHGGHLREEARELLSALGEP